MGLPHNSFLYALWDNQNRSYAVNPDGSVYTTTEPKFLDNKPIGWGDIELSFNTSEKYFSNIKALSVPLQYVLDGAQILRWLLYKGKGIYEEIYCVIFRWNRETGVHELEYRGRLDLSKCVDDPEIGVTLNAKEGGLQADLDANESVTYELHLDVSNPDTTVVQFDGVTLKDKFNYQTYESFTADVQTATYSTTTLHSIDTPYVIAPLVFQNNEGDSIGVTHGDPQFEAFHDTTYLNTSNNTFFENFFETGITINILGKYDFSVSTTYAFTNQPALFKAYIYIKTKTGLTEIEIASFDIIYGNAYSIDINQTITLTGISKVFLVFRMPTELTFITVPGDGRIVKYETTFGNKNNVSINFDSINPPSPAFAMRPLDIANQLVKKWNTKYSVKSDFLTVHNNIIATSGTALRNLKKAVLKYSFKDFFDDYNALYCLCINLIGNVMYIEQREARYKVTTDTLIYDLGSVSAFKIKPGTTIYSSLKTGWPNQDYNERNGKYEFNAETEWKLPQLPEKNELNLVSKGRGDSYGMEFIRGKLNNKDTTDNKGDNEVFLINTTQRTIVADIEIFVTTNPTFTNFIHFVGLDAEINNFVVGGRIRLTGAGANDRSYKILGKSQIVVNQFDLWVDNYSAALTPGVYTGVTIEVGVLHLKRKVYTTLSGIPTPNIDGGGAAYNIEEMTPSRKLRIWGSYLHSLLFQLPSDKITFQTSTKNKELIADIIEKANVNVSELASPFFLNYVSTFTTITPLTFSKVMSNLLRVGNIKTNYNGFDLFFLPIGKMTSRPATNSAQEWELTLSAFNDVETLYKLSQESLYINDGMNNTLTISVLNPVHFVYYNKTLTAKYKYKDYFDDWVHHRNNQFAQQPSYVQKWQFSDTINLQFITNGIGQIELYVYDCWAIQQGTAIISTIVTNPAIKTPYVLQQATIDPNNYLEGSYIFVLKSNGVILAISEWQSIKEDQENTYIIDYSNSYNKLSAYFAAWTPMIRVEAMWHTERAEASSSDYEDEDRSQTLGFNSWTLKKLLIGSPFGIPEYLHIKLNNIFFLDRMYVEGTHFTRMNDSKWEIGERNGYPLNTYAIDLRRANSDQDFRVTAEGFADINEAIYTLDAEAYGQAPGVITVQIDDN